MSHWMRGGAAIAGLGLLIGSLAACSGDDPGESGEPDDETTSAAPALQSTVKVAQVAGRLPRAPRQRLTADVGKVVDDWIDAAHVGGEWPRTIGSEAWAGFTSQAAGMAKADTALTSASEISEKVDSVTATKRVVRLDVLAQERRARGVTARVVLDYDTTGEVAGTVQVRGRLLLTPTKNGWKIFGYDLTEGKR